MAGSNSGFDADGFREGIRFAMTMGLPEDESQRATFYFAPARTLDGKIDSNDLPLDWAADIVDDDTPDPVTVPVAFEMDSRANEQTAAGRFDTPTVTITVLDEDYADIEGASYCVIGDATYDIEFVGPPLGLFDVTIYQLFLRARDER